MSHRGSSRGGRGSARLWLAALLAAAAPFALVACGDDGESADGSTTTSAPAQEDSSPIVVGLLDEQTGPTAAVQGKAGDGARAAVEVINDSGGIDGRQVELVTRDTKGDANATLQAIGELKDEGAVAIVGPVNGALCQAVPAGLTRAGIPGICLSPADLPEQDEQLFGIGVELAQIDEASFELLAEENGKVGVLAQKTALGQLMEDHVAEYGDDDVEFSVERVEPTDTSASAQVQKLIDADVGGILIGPCGPLALTAAKEAVDLGYQGKIMLYTCFASDAGAQGAKGFANGNVMTLASQFALRDVPEGDPQYEAYQAYVDAGVEHDSVTATGWDGMFMLKKAIEGAGSTEPDAIVAELEDDFEFAGVWSLNRITAEDHRGADSESALIPVVFTPEGTMQRTED